MLSRAGILRRNCGDCGEHGGGHKEQEADDLFHNSDSRSYIDAAAVRDRCDDKEGDLDHSLLERDRNTDSEELSHVMTVRDKVTLLNRQRAVPSDQKDQRQEYGHSLCGNCRDRGAGCPHCERADQKIVESDVDKACDRHEDHRALCVAESPENAADHVVSRDKRHAGKADHQIVPGLLEGLRRHCQNAQNPVCGDQKHQCQYSRHSRKERRGVADKSCCLPL